MSDPLLERVTRDELYDLVWSKPLTALAAKFGVPNVVIAKTCDKLRVPRPGQGHWQRVALGEVPPRLALPAAGLDIPTEAVFGRAEARKAPQVVVGDALPAAVHAVVRQLRSRLSTAHPGLAGMKAIRGRGHAVLRLTPNTEKRALRILDALLRALEDRGHKARLREGTVSALEVLVSNGGAVELWLMEHQNQVEHVLTKKEIENRKRGSSSWVPTYDVTASGRLIFETDTPWGYELRKKWSDGKTQRLEDLLGEIVLGLEDIGAAVREVSERNDRARRAQEDQQVERAAEQRRRAHREGLAKDLVSLARAWSQATEVRAFLAATEQRVPEGDRHEGFVPWLDWAKEFAEELDPLSHPEKLAKVLQPKEPPAPASSWEAVAAGWGRR
jgi:hypothetical protein